MGYSYAIVGAIRRMTRAPMIVTGKPSLHALRCAADRLGMSMSELAVVGDDPELEVPMAHLGDSLAISVSTGVGEDEAFAGLPEEIRPHLRLEGVGDLLSLLPPAAPRAR